MSDIVIRGVGAVSPAGWGKASLCQSVAGGVRAAVQDLQFPGSGRAGKVLRVPPVQAKPAFAAHPRLRRASPIGQYAVAAALEAIGEDKSAFANGKERLGIIYCAMAGCVNFSRRFYDETLKDPSTASPVIFPETVFNAPASHLGALLESSARNYTLVGDPGTFLQGLALAADWLTSGAADGCLVVGAEELDWLVVQAFELFDPTALTSEGAGALYLRRGPQINALAELQAVTDSHPFTSKTDRRTAAALARTQAKPDPANGLLCDGTQAVPRLDSDECAAWKDWTGGRVSPKKACGEAFMASAAWQCVVAVNALTNKEYESAHVSVVGCNQQAIVARFGRVHQ